MTSTKQGKQETINNGNSLTQWTTAAKLLESINLCDIVEFNRITYSHYGFYIGEGVCVHVQAPDKSSIASSSRSSSSSSTKRSKSYLGTKVAEHLIKIAAGDFVRVNNAEFIAFRLGVNRRSTSNALELAKKDLPLDLNGNLILGTSINVEYFLLSSNNCEGWSTYWRYNHPQGFSIQATNGAIHSMIGTVERFTDSAVCCAKSILTDDNASAVQKATAAVAVVPFTAISFSATCVKKVSDFAAGGIMRMFD
ncbi:Phospholipase A and acyltransferase 2 [Pseudolycoriella hygida]|uniref:Phospholipase A and acyltransferase 2 n=1 Tax=Pseudolycoriella hygida TaxID=35572 RepID=A0A9Q0N4E1_9DIPT|nr:Phospholipase A and acyltransferase 2 [Pseudolycoriella hygida]